MGEALLGILRADPRAVLLLRDCEPDGDVGDGGAEADGGAAAAAPPPSTSSIALLEARSR